MALNLVGLPTIGLALIAIGWIIQLLGPVIASAKKEKEKKGFERYELQKGFLMAYSLGVAFLVIDGFANASAVPTGLNVVCAVSALLLLLKSK